VKLNLIVKNFSVRIGRLIYMYGMSIFKNNPTTNGEYDLIRCILKSSDREQAIVFDVGGNIGEWTDCAIKVSKKQNIKLSSYIFEPAQDSYQFLKIKFSDKNVRIYNRVISDLAGMKNFYINGSLCGTNSLEQKINSNLIEVQSITLDDFIKINQINRVDFVKCDVEGFDLSVIKGSRNALKNNTIRALQFEYNHRWIANRAYLRDVFDEAAVAGCVVCKIIPKGLIVYESWNGELERFYESNYVLLKKSDPVIKKNLIVKKFNESNLPVYE
jgi:FkbM family methyltransferase